MLYRAKANVLFVLPAPGALMLSRLRPHRDRLEQRQSPKPARPARGPVAATTPGPGVVPLIPDWSMRDQERWRGEAEFPPAEAMARTIGRWRRICFWWLFTEDELDLMLR